MGTTIAPASQDYCEDKKVSNHTVLSTGPGTELRAQMLEDVTIISLVYEMRELRLPAVAGRGL